MADTTVHLAPGPDLEPAGPLDNWSARFAELAPVVRLHASPVAQAVIRPTGQEALQRLGLPAACRLRRTEDATVIWLGPDEYLAWAADVAPHEFAASIADRVQGEAYVADASGQRTRIELGGPRAETILAHGCAIDLSPRAFGPDDVAQTLLAQAAVIVHRVPDGFAIFVRSSYADYLAAWLVDAATEYVADPTPAPLP
ncbi:sarcosine oxidase subunit gamma [Gordonia sp. HS-NH1]|uniref:sarcosine oxidase subunit gamma n=1 Tax=Gordonia sp. HS-NH1 TaxID=1435068 RepID=UPI0006E1B5FC|nr:sarcosine oxidase subunit gamma family protein [Gordonia sp. HS-NH1]